MLDVLQQTAAVVVHLILVGVAYLVARVYMLNGSIKAIYVWQKQHERQDDERHVETREEIRGLRAIMVREEK